MVRKGDDGRWYKPCPQCKVEQSYLRKSYAEASLAQGKRCKKCTQNDSQSNGTSFYKDIRTSWFKGFKSSAADRGLDFEISIEDVWEVFEEQDFKCALTGWDIGWAKSGHPQQSTASIDRIDSSLGYVLGNIQIVHKHVNMMKQHYDNDYFIETCKAVAEQHKTKW